MSSASVSRLTTSGFALTFFGLDFLFFDALVFVFLAFELVAFEILDFGGKANLTVSALRLDRPIATTCYRCWSLLPTNDISSIGP